MHDIGDLTVKQYAFILNTIFSTQDTLKKLNKIKKNKPTSVIHIVVAFSDSLENRCVPVGVYVCQSTRAQQINSYQVKGYDAFYLIKSQ